MSMLVLAGDDLNILRRTGATITCSPAADALFPVTNVYDGRPGAPFKFGSNVGGYVQVDQGDGIGGFGILDNWSAGSPLGWTEADASGGDVVQDNAIKHSGSSSANFRPGAGGTASIKIQATSVRTSYYYKLQAWMQGQAPSLLVCRVQDLRNGLWLTSAGAWQVSVADAFTQSGASFTLESVVFKTQSFETLLAASTTLEITFFATSSAQQSWVDDVELIAGVDFVSVHGHNIDPVVAPTLLSGDSSGSIATLEATLTPQVGAFYSLLGARVYHRYFKLNLPNANSVPGGAIYIGELNLGQALPLTRGPDYPLRLRYITPQVRGSIGGFGSYAYGLARHHQLGVSVDLQQTEAAHREFFLEVFMRAINGAALVAVPDSNDPREITMARFPMSYDLSRVLTTWRKLGAIDLDPLPLPMLVS